MKISATIALSGVLLMLAGCIIPYPHTTPRFAGVSGRVLDAKTHQPVAGVSVAIHDHPSTVTKTDSSGNFHLSAERNHHLFIIPAPCAVGEGDYWSPLLDISHADYQTLGFDAYQHADPSTRDKGELVTTDILLEPK
jgi:hypothetical protein